MDLHIFDHALNIVTIASAGAMVVAAVVLYIVYLPRVRRVCRMGVALPSAESEGFMIDEEPEGMPSASVVIFAQDESERLKTLLPAILNQDYPGRLEVIVVNEGQNVRTQEVIGLLSVDHKNLYHTNTPDGVRNLSRRKLALTLGIKAAHNDIIVLTNAGTEIGSDQWLRQMLEPMKDDYSIDIVLGYAAPSEDTERGWRRRSFYRAVTDVEWLSAALGSHPWRGTGYNLAYRRQTFFDNKGFSKSLNLRDGDDDVFISQIATPKNTAVVITPESRLREIHANARRAWNNETLRRMFTSEFDMGSATRRLFGFCSLTVWVMVLGMLCAIAAETVEIVASTDQMPAWDFSAQMFMSPIVLHSASVLLTLIIAFSLWIPVVRTWRRTMAVLDLKPLRWSIPWLMFTRPLVTLILRFRFRRHRSSGYTWSK